MREEGHPSPPEASEALSACTRRVNSAYAATLGAGNARCGPSSCMTFWQRGKPTTRRSERKTACSVAVCGFDGTGEEQTTTVSSCDASLADAADVSDAAPSMWHGDGGATKEADA